MRKNILVIACLIIISNAFGQGKEYTFRPKWKVGDKKTVMVAEREKKYKNYKLVEDTTIYSETKITVLKEDDNFYVLGILYENIAMKAAISFYDKLGEELPKYRNLELKYRVNKKTGKSELINWKEAQSFMNESLNQITGLIKKKTPEMAKFSELIFAPIKEMFKSKQNIESYMTDEISYLFFPYDKKFVSGDTLKITGSTQNPFKPGDTISQTTLSYLTRIDDSKKMCDINSIVLLDLSEFKKMMKTMMTNMAKSFGADSTKQADAAKEIDKMDFKMSHVTVTTFDYRSTWPVKSVVTVKVVVDDPKNTSEKIVTKTITIK